MWAEKAVSGVGFDLLFILDEFHTELRVLFHMILDQTRKVESILLMVVVAMLPHAEIGGNDHREDAPQFTSLSLVQVLFNYSK